MIPRVLGSTNIRISAIGLGTVKLGRTEGVKYPTASPLPTDAEAADLIDIAADLDINLIDTAPAYGSSEERLGALLAGQRDRWVISTKVGEEFAEGKSRYDFSPPAIRASVERSLKRLRTDRLDVVLLHSDGLIELAGEREDSMLELRRLQREGKIRAIGASTKTLQGARWAVSCCEVVMLTLNPGAMGDAPAVDQAAEAGVGVLIKKALDSGHLAAGPGTDPIEHALRFVFSHRGVSSVVIGTVNPHHLEDNVRAAERALQGA